MLSAFWKDWISVTTAGYTSPNATMMRAGPMKAATVTGWLARPLTLLTAKSRTAKNTANPAMARNIWRNLSAVDMKAILPPARRPVALGGLLRQV